MKLPLMNLLRRLNIFVLFLLLCFSVTSVAWATPNVYTWTEQTGSGSRMWKGIAGSSDLTKLYAVELSGGRIYRSLDSGATWSQTNASTQSWLGIASSPDGVNVAAISNLSGNVYVSTNSGLDWSVSSGAGTRNWTAVTTASSGSMIIATAYSQGIYISTTTGSTWVTATNAGNRNWQAVAASADGTKLIAAVNPGALYISSDSGSNWSIASASTTAAWQAVAMSADGTKMVAAVKGGLIYTSTDSGSTWTASAAPTASWQSIAVSNDGARIVAGIDIGTIYVSPNGGASWVQQTAPGTRLWFGAVSSSDASKVALTAYNGNIWTGTLDITPPVVSLDPHLSGRHFGPASSFFSAQATDNQGVASVQFYIDNVAYGSAMTTPTVDNLYNPSVNPSLLGDGTYVLTAVATDITGNTATSSPITFYVHTTGATLAEVENIASTITSSTATYRYTASYSLANSNTQQLRVLSCGDASISASALSTSTVNSIFLEDLSIGTTYTCTVKLEDAAGNNSNILQIGPFTRIAQSVSSSNVSGSRTSGGGLVYGCKDTRARNYNYFSAHDASLCVYDTNSSKAQIDSSIVPLIATLSTSAATSSRYVFTTNLSFRMEGTDVLELQKFLSNKGLLPVAPNGYFGPATRSALMKFQSSNNIPATGFFGPRTRALVNVQY